MVQFRQGGMSRELALELINGAYAIECVIHTDPPRHLYAALSRMDVRTEISHERFNLNPINEIVVLNDYDATNQRYVRVGAPGRLAQYRLNEHVYVERKLESDQARVRWAVRRLAEQSRTIDSDFTITQSIKFEDARVALQLVDPVAMLNDRFAIPTTTGPTFPNPTLAATYISSLIDSAMINPTLHHRAIAARVSAEHDGLLIDEPVRWKRLGRSVRRACEDGEIGIRTEFDPDTPAIHYIVTQGRDRRVGDEHDIFDHRIDVDKVLLGDYAERPIWLHTTDIEPLDTLVSQCVDADADHGGL